MALAIGIVGLPNVGKSTLFNALLKKQAAFVANFPFATIEPNVGIVPVPDKRLEVLADIVAGNPSTSLRTSRPPVVPATVRFVDIAGLVKGAAKGQGLGNKFLSHIREVDAICEVVRHFKDKDVIHVGGEPNPESDKSIVNTELMLADLQTLEKQQGPKKIASKDEIIRFSAIGKLKKTLDEGKLARECKLNDEEKILVKDLALLTFKPIIYVANVDESDLKNNFGEDTIAISAKIEQELSELSESEQKEYLLELGLKEQGLERLVKKAYETLNLISFLTAGEKEVRAWTIQKGMKAVEAAGVIHTDFIANFIKAEAVFFDDFVQSGGWKRARELGKARMEGRDYIVKDGDVVEFKIGRSS
ncbi:MAG: redox-regulated ATPase YchF [Candidatus Levyibacteriota bacterium]